MKHLIKIHGTNTSYNYGCRCEECKKAHAEYNYESNKKYVRKYRAKVNVIKMALESEPFIHFNSKRRR